MGRLSVFLDPGHGGEDPGVVDNGIVEKNFVRYFASSLYWLLHGTHWIRPHISRAADKNITLEEAGKLAEVCETKLAIAIHVNRNQDPRVSGMMTFFLSGDEIGKRIANEIQRMAPADLRRRSDSSIMATENIWPRVVNVLTPYWARGIPSLLIELGFASNKTNATLLNTPLTRHQLMGSILAGLEQLRYEYGE